MHAKLHADISSLLELIEKSPLPAAAAAVVALHEMLDAHVKVKCPDALVERCTLNRRNHCQHRLCSTTQAMTQYFQRRRQLLAWTPLTIRP